MFNLIISWIVLGSIFIFLFLIAHGMGWFKFWKEEAHDELGKS